MMGAGALFLLLLFLVLVGSDYEDERVNDLLQRQASAKDGIIVLDDASVRHFAVSMNRPYSLVIFFDAVHLKERSDLKLDDLKVEFEVMAHSYIKNNAGKDSEAKVFFCSLEFQQSQASFQMFGVSSLPHIRYLGSGSGTISSSEVLEMNENSRSAEGMAAFVESKSRQKVGEILRPPIMSRTQLLMVAGMLAVAAPFVIKFLMTHDNTPVHDPKVWCASAICIYFFSVSGGMHNIIRKMPMFMMDRNIPGKMIFFYQGSGMQLGAEGFVVGYLYTLVGVIIAFITHFLVKVKSKGAQRLMMLIGLGACCWSVRKVVMLDNWKTGYGVHSYFRRS